VVDLRRDEARSELGVNLEQLTGARARAHGLAKRARDLGAEGMVVPSAAQPDAWNLVVFPSGFERVRTAGSRAMHPRPPGRIGQEASRRRTSST
jgi:RES domain-containing protein